MTREKPASPEQQDDGETWRKGLRQLRHELDGCPEPDRRELAGMLAEVTRLKVRLLQVSDAAEGEFICASCRGACCRAGRYHMNALELLACLVKGDTPPEPDFHTGACPFLGPSGCRIPPAYRPRTCVIFVCDLIDERLTGADREQFNRLEADLQRQYDTIGEKFGRLLAVPFLFGAAVAVRDGVRLLSCSRSASPGGFPDGDRNP